MEAQALGRKGHSLLKTAPTDPGLDVDALFAAERVLPTYRSEFRERALSSARHETPIISVPPSASRWARQPRHIFVATGTVLALASAAAAAFEIQQRRKHPSELPAIARTIDAPAGIRPGRFGTALAPGSSTPLAAQVAASIPVDGYEGELQILEPARLAFALSYFAAVIRAADEHERRFPSGGLAEERDALRISALFCDKRVAESRRAAALFHKTFPNSALLREIGSRCSAN